MEILINYDYREEDMKRFDVLSLAKFVLESEEQPENTVVSINFVDNDAIHNLNRDFRGIDNPTDVLSFECDGIDDDFADIEDDGEFELGDIVVAPDIAVGQAKEYGVSFEEEIYLLVAHGLLHLCGFDHIEEDEARAMEQRERELLSAYLGHPFNV